MKNSADLGGCYPPRPSASVDNTLLDLQNTPIPEKTGGCMQARLNSPTATNMADEISEELGNSWNVCKFRATCPEQMLKKGKKLDTSAV